MSCRRESPWMEDELPGEQEHLGRRGVSRGMDAAVDWCSRVGGTLLLLSADGRRWVWAVELLAPWMHGGRAESLAQ
jgi:hypothetical protein